MEAEVWRLKAGVKANTRIRLLRRGTMMMVVDWVFPDGGATGRLVLLSFILLLFFGLPLVQAHR